MKSAVFTTFAVAALSVSAAPANSKPAAAAATIDDTTVLNFALILEHLENAFYSEALAKFDDKAFTDAGLPSYARARFVEVGKHEAAHVAFLSQALGVNATKPCNYSFPYTDPKSFAALSQTLEGVGVTAYTGAAQLITNKSYLTAAASVLATEARHASWVAAAVNKVSGWSGALDVPLGLDEVYTLAAPFITGCPSSNPVLPVKAFPSLVFPAGALPGKDAALTFDRGNKTGDLFVAFYTGLGQEVVPITVGKGNGSVSIPGDLVGTVYAVVTSNGTAATDATTVAGPAVLTFDFDSEGVVMR